MSDEAWHEARLIPTSGISGAEEQERRATSAVLAVMSVVKEFSKAVLGPLGAISGNVETYIEVPFMLGEKRCYPDGLIRVTRGARSWTALVEVKTGKNELQTEQLENYLDIAKEQGFDALITISNRSRDRWPASRPRSTSASCARWSCITGRGPTCSPRRSCRKSTAGSLTLSRPGFWVS